MWRGVNRGSVRHFLLVQFEDVVEVGRDRERLALAGKLVRRNVGEELVLGRPIQFSFEVLGVDSRIPVEALDDAFCLDLGLVSSATNASASLALAAFTGTAYYIGWPRIPGVISLSFMDG